MTQDTERAPLADLSGRFTGQAVLFDLGDVRCALPLSDVAEVARVVRISPLPTAPSIVEGVIDVRGAVVPVLDLRGRLGLRPVPVRPEQFLILAWTDVRLVAVRVDAIDWIVSLEREQLVGAEQIARGIGSLLGVARTAEGLILVHDLSQFFRQGESEALEAALERGSRDGGRT